MTLQRYDLDSFLCISKREDGDFVLYEDVQELIAERDKLRAEVERLREAAKALLHQIDGSVWLEQDTGFLHSLAANQRVHEMREALKEPKP